MSSVSSVNSLLSSTTSSSSGIDVSSILATVAGATTAGIDVSGAVDAALYADRAEERVWQTQQATLTSQASALTAIQTATASLSSDFESLNSLVGPLASRSVTSSEPSAITASAAAGTVSGNHTITVTNLATTASWYSDQASSATATLPQSSFTLTVASGSSTTINIGQGGVNTLNDVASAINGASLGVTASIVTDANGARLSIVSNSVGSANNFTITSSPTTGTSWSTPDFSTGQTLGADSFTITQSGVTTTINTTDGESLSDLASNINSQGLGVTASVVSDSGGSHLSIVSTDGTTPFTISEPAFGFTQAAQGVNANLTVDGVPVSSASNTVTGAIPGVTINLAGTTPTGIPATLSVAANTTTIGNAITQFVSDYNSAIKLVNSQYTFDGTSGAQGVLASDPTIRSLQQSLLSVLNYVHAPATGVTTTPTLASLGITAGTDGTLSIDTDTLGSALVNNASDVQDFFIGSSLNGFASSVQSALSSFTNPATGAFSVDLQSINSTNNDLTDHINDFESVYIANQKTLLTAMYSQAESALQALPTQMKQIQAELGNNSGSSN